MTALFRYVRWHRVPAFLAMGWHFCGPAHPEWSALMRACDCNPEGRVPR